MRFKNRLAAALELACVLKKYQVEVVLAIPRGGLELGAPLAKSLGAPLDVILVKKVGHPQNPEYAIGAVSARESVLDKGYTSIDVTKLQESLKEREEIYRGKRSPLSIEGKTVIVTDDGVATGKTLLLTLKLLKKQKPKKIIVAVPVAPVEVVKMLERECDEVVCLERAKDFFAISQFYETFDQVREERAIKLLSEANAWK